jgi:hypothetical protein
MSGISFLDFVNRRDKSETLKIKKWKLMDSSNKQTNKAVMSWVPVIVAIGRQRSEIRGIAVPGQPRQKKKKKSDPISKIPNTKKAWWSGSSGRVPSCQASVRL